MNKEYNFTKKDLLLVVILSITVLFCSYAISWHDIYKEHNINQSIITKYISEVSFEELNSYIIENPNTFVYFGVPGEEKTILFEKEFKNTINRYYLKDKVIYVNAKERNTTNFKSDLSFPTVVYFEEGKVLEHINYDNNDMSNKSIIRFFRLYGDL